MATAITGSAGTLDTSISIPQANDEISAAYLATNVWQPMLNNVAELEDRVVDANSSVTALSSSLVSTISSVSSSIKTTMASLTGLRYIGSTGITFGNGTSFILGFDDLSSGFEAGDVLIVQSASPSQTPPSGQGWLAVLNHNWASSTRRHQIWAKVWGVGFTDSDLPEFTFSSDDYAAIGIVIRGLATNLSNQLQITSTTQQTGTATVQSPSYTASKEGDVLLHFFISDTLTTPYIVTTNGSYRSCPEARKIYGELADNSTNDFALGCWFGKAPWQTGSFNDFLIFAPGTSACASCCLSVPRLIE